MNDANAVDLNETAPPEESESRSLTQRILDGIERAGNKVPNPVMMFVYLIVIVIVIVLSAILDLAGVSVTEEILVPVTEDVEEIYWPGLTTEPDIIITEKGYEGEYVIVEEEVSIKSLLTIDGLRFILTSFVDNFAGFNVVAVIFVAMIGVGVAEEAGLMAALIRGLVRVAPRQLLTFIIVFIGGLSSVATDAGN